MMTSPIASPLAPTVTPCPRGLLPNPLGLLHRDKNPAKKPFSPDKVLVKAAVVGATVGGIAAGGYTTHGAFFAEVAKDAVPKAIAKLDTAEKVLAISVGSLMGGVLGGFLSTIGTFIWRGIVNQWKPPVASPPQK